jgi:hypothetical protein
MVEGEKIEREREREKTTRDAGFRVIRNTWESIRKLHKGY